MLLVDVAALPIGAIQRAIGAVWVGVPDGGAVAVVGTATSEQCGKLRAACGRPLALGGARCASSLRWVAVGDSRDRGENQRSRVAPHHKKLVPHYEYASTSRARRRGVVGESRRFVVDLRFLVCPVLGPPIPPFCGLFSFFLSVLVLARASPHLCRACLLCERVVLFKNSVEKFGSLFEEGWVGL